MFVLRDFDAGFDKKKPSDQACTIGHIVSACRYMALDETQKRLGNTIKALDAVLYVSNRL